MTATWLAASKPSICIKKVLCNIIQSSDGDVQKQVSGRFYCLAPLMAWTDGFIGLSAAPFRVHRFQDVGSLRWLQPNRGLSNISFWKS